MKKLMISLVIATSSCFAILSPANAASHKTETHSSQVQHQKGKAKAKQVVASKHKVTKKHSKSEPVKKATSVQYKKVQAEDKNGSPKHFTAQKRVNQR